jgi:thiol-disulfide isomerase/thioredoxin
MSEIQSERKTGRPRRDPVTLALYGLALLALAAVVYVIVSAVGKPKGADDLKGLAHGEMAKLVIAPSPGGAPPPDTVFLDAQGKSVRLADLKSGVMIVNLWATWCAPCRAEMPTLAKLQAAYPGRVEVIPIAMDQAEDREKARAFIGQYPPLPFYQDPKLAMTFALTPASEGLPTTVIYDHTGRERARYTGGADWDGADARAVIDALLRAP